MKCEHCGHDDEQPEVIKPRQLVKRYVIRFETISDTDLKRLTNGKRCDDGHIQIDVSENSEKYAIAQELKDKYQTTTREYSFGNEYQ